MSFYQLWKTSIDPDSTERLSCVRYHPFWPDHISYSLLQLFTFEQQFNNANQTTIFN